MGYLSCFFLISLIHSISESMLRLIVLVESFLVHISSHVVFPLVLVGEWRLLMRFGGHDQSEEVDSNFVGGGTCIV